MEDCGADVNATDDHGFSPLLMAAWAGRLAAVEWLLTREDLELGLEGVPPQSSSFLLRHLPHAFSNESTTSALEIAMRHWTVACPAAGTVSSRVG